MPVYTHTRTHIHEKNTKQASNPVLREIHYFYGVQKTVMMITLPQWKPS